MRRGQNRNSQRVPLGQSQTLRVCDKQGERAHDPPLAGASIKDARIVKARTHHLDDRQRETAL